jgi:hypothetical protein
MFTSAASLTLGLLRCDPIMSYLIANRRHQRRVRG